MSLFTIASLQNPSPAGEAASQFAPLGAAINVLMVWPRFPASFWGFQGMMSLLPEKTAMPPLGLITVAALCPKSWNVRLIDRAFDQLPDAQLLWSDLVMVSGMHVQKGDIADILRRGRG